MSFDNRFYRIDCVEGCKKHIPSGSVDLIVTDPPYGIEGDQLHRHYHRKEDFVIDGYVEVPQEDYAEFSRQWILQAERILRPGGSMYIVSGYTNLIDILNALKETSLKEVNHLIWKFNFGVYTFNKYISSHYHILYYVKPGGEVTFNTYCRYGQEEKSPEGGALNYLDREDVWIVNREYKPGQKKNKNELPKQLLIKLIQYSSNEGDLVCDPFLGSFSTAKVAIGLNRRATGFEMSQSAYDYQMEEIAKVIPGSLLGTLRQPAASTLTEQKKRWSRDEKESFWKRYLELASSVGSKKECMRILGEEFGRGRFAVLNMIDQLEAERGEARNWKSNRGRRKSETKTEKREEQERLF